MKKVIVLLLSAGLSLTSWHGFADSSIDVEANKAKIAVEKSALVNINVANEEQLLSLKGIGKAKAQAIMSYRDAMGPFTTVEELLQVEGIGKRVIEINSKRLTI